MLICIFQGPSCRECNVLQSDRRLDRFVPARPGDTSPSGLAHLALADTATPLVSSRLHSILASSVAQTSPPPSSAALPAIAPTLLSSLHHFTVPTLAHMLALLATSPARFPPPRTSLLVIDSTTPLFPPGPASLRPTSSRSNPDVQWAIGRRSAMPGELISRLARLAATHNIAILLLNQAAMKITPDRGAVLRPAVAGKAWDAGVATRIALWRDWWIPPPAPLGETENEKGEKAEEYKNVRFAGITKALGAVGRVGKVVPFVIAEVTWPSTPPTLEKGRSSRQPC
jgi:hypothetical protein